MEHSNRSTLVRSTADLARYAGVARTTVSRVLNGHPGIKAKTMEKVRRAMRETGFAPNAAAKKLRGKGDQTIGICMETLFTPPMVAKLGLLQRRLREREILSLIEVVDQGQVHHVVEHFRSMQAQAIIFIGQFDASEIKEQVALLRRQRLGHLLIDQTDVEGANAVSIDRETAMKEVVHHLLDLNHRSFGILGMNKPAESVRARLRGIAAALEERGLDIARNTQSLDFLVAREQDFAFGRAMAEAFSRRPDRPTAYMCVNDEVAVGAVVAFREHGVQVPGDVSVVGFNNQDICLMCSPHLTTVDQQIEETIHAALDMVMAEVSKPSTKPMVRMIPPLFVERGSTGPASAVNHRTTAAMAPSSG